MANTERFERVGIDKLVPYAKNARTHSPQQIEELRASLREFGFVAPVLVDEKYNIIAGHCRVLAAKKEGVKEIPCVFTNKLTEAQKRAYILADNRLALNAGWDIDILAGELSDLKLDDFDISVLGFSDKELDALLGEEMEAQEDDFDPESELKKPCLSRAGDIWQIGRHRVICGDSTQPETYTKLLGKTKVNLVLTDPPYFVGYRWGKIENDNLTDEKGYLLLRTSFDNFNAAMAKDASIYVFYASIKARIFYDAYEDAGFKVGKELIWKKDVFTIARADWNYIHEPIIYGWKKSDKHLWYGDRKQSTVFEFARNKRQKAGRKEDERGDHPSAKPIPLLGYLIQQSTMENGLVLDGFLGSAATLIACEQLNRVCYGIELEPKYIDVAVKRYINTAGSGEGVFLLRDGQKIPFADVTPTGE